MQHATTQDAEPSLQTFSVSGTVMGGPLPVIGSHIYLFAANIHNWAGPGIAAQSANASFSLLKNVQGMTTADSNGNYYVTTDALGGFSLSGDYTACNQYQGLYIFATGGNAMGGSPTGTGPMDGNNANIGLMADIGMCSASQSSLKIVLNEMSTVAAAYALSGMATDALHIGSDAFASGGNPTKALALTGYANAFANAANLVSAGAPLATTPGSNSLVTGTVPVATLDTIANILAGCVQSSGLSSTTSPACSDLFTFTGTTSSTVSSVDTATAAIRLAQNPVGVSGSSVTIAKLFGDIAPQAAFLPNLATAPNDFTLAIAYSGSGLNGPYGIAVDAAGSVWVMNNGNSTLTQLYGNGAAYSATGMGATGSDSYSVAVDGSGNVWTSGNNNYLYEFSGSGTSYTGTTTSIQGGSAGQTNAIAFDASQNLWAIGSILSGTRNLVYQFNNGTELQAYQNQNSYGAGFDGVAVDSGGVVRISGNYGLFILTSSGSGNPYSTNSALVARSQGIAIATNGSVWVTSGSYDGTTSIANYAASTTGSLFQNPAFSVNNGGLGSPRGIAVDGAGNVWVANNTTAAITAATSTGALLTPSTGFTGTAGTAGGTSGPLGMGSQGIALDGSGNVWVADQSTNTVVQFIGAAVPVITPIVNGVVYGKIGAKP